MCIHRDTIKEQKNKKNMKYEGSEVKRFSNHMHSGIYLTLRIYVYHLGQTIKKSTENNVEKVLQ